MKIALLGCGSIGRRHALNLAALPDVRVLALDPDPGKRAEIEALGIRFLDYDLASLWREKPDVCVVAAPSRDHLALSVAAARQGCHLFIEKPLAVTEEGLDELETACREKGLVQMVACNMRFHAGPAALKRWVDEGRLGKLIYGRFKTGSYLPAWRPQTDYRMSYSASPESGGVILDCIHELDLAAWILGPACFHSSVVLPASGLGLSTDGLAEIVCRHGEGVLGSIHLNFIQRDYQREVEIIGSEGSARWNIREGKAELYDQNGNVAESKSGAGLHTVDAMYVEEMKHFLDAVRTKEIPYNTLSEARATLRVALQARAAAGAWK